MRTLDNNSADGMLSNDEFEAYYRNVSALIDDDAYFEARARAAAAARRSSVGVPSFPSVGRPSSTSSRQTSGRRVRPRATVAAPSVVRADPPTRLHSHRVPTRLYLCPSLSQERPFLAVASLRLRWDDGDDDDDDDDAMLDDARR